MFFLLAFRVNEMFYVFVGMSMFETRSTHGVFGLFGLFGSLCTSAFFCNRSIFDIRVFGVCGFFGLRKSLGR